MLKLTCVFVFASTALVCWASEKIVFLRMGPAQAKLYISNADGSAEQPLTQPGSLDYDPSWSPKGDWIVFTSERGGSADLYRIHPDGTGLDRLTDDPAFDDQATFSPDEKQVVFVSTRASGTANLWILDVATHQARPLTSGHGGDFRPAWSPDGKWIAFSSDRESSLPPAKGRWERLHLFDVYVIRPDGSGLKRFSSHGNFCGSPKWTPDSKSLIAYCMSADEQDTYRFPDEDENTHVENRIMKIDISNGETKPVAAGPGIKVFPAMLASGEIGYFRRDKPQGVFYTSGKAGPAGENVRSPSWSPDGTRVVYSRYERNYRPEPRKLWSRSLNYELATTGTFLPAYDSTGERFVVTDRNLNKTTLLIVDEGKPARTILERKEDILGPQWSPDDRQIVFGIGRFALFNGGEKAMNAPNGEQQLGIVNADGSGFQLITSGANKNAFPSFAPDGKRIVYRTTGPDGEGLRILNLEDHSITVLTDEYDNFPLWSPRGDLIAFVRKIGDDFEIFTIRPNGKNMNQLTHTKGNDAHMAWSPDGEHIVFTSSRMGFKDEALYSYAPQPYGEIFVMKYDGTEVEQLTDNQWEDGGPAWQPHRKNPPMATTAICTRTRSWAPTQAGPSH